MHVIGVGMGVDHAIKAADISVQQLGAHVGAGVDQDGRRAGLRYAFHQYGTAAARVFGVGRITRPPMAAEAGHAAGRAAAKDSDPHLGHQVAS